MAYAGPNVVIQEGNSSTKYRFEAMPSYRLAKDTRIGSGAYSSFWKNDLPNWKSILDQITDLGVRRLDTSLPEIEEPIFWDWSETEIPKEYDSFIDGLNDNGIAVNYLLHYWDKQGHARGEELSTPRFKTEAQIQDFLDYVRWVVGHFSGRVQYYTIWTEPDNCIGDAIKCIEPDDYITLVRKTVPVIHEEDPQAKVALAPNVLFFDRDFLFKVLESDIMSTVDVVQWHGIYIVVPGSEFYGDYYYEYPQIIADIIRTAKANGFQGEFWGTELSYCSEEYSYCHAPDQPWGLIATDKLAAKYYARVIVMQLGMDVGTGLPSFIEGTGVPWSIPTIRNLHTIFTGSKPISLPLTIADGPPDASTYAFETPERDTLLAVWTNGIAVDDDPGVSTTLILPATTSQIAVAVDPLFGLEQVLATEMEDGNLVIRNFLIKDYPTIVRLEDSAP
jgi:hypothetical protein